MNRQRYNALRQLLLRKRGLLLRDMQVIERETLNQPDHSGFDLAEEGVFNSEKEIEFSILYRNQQQLRRIDEALERLKRRRYGNCRMCSKDIPLKRLKAIPFADLCVNCQQQDEQEMVEEKSEYSRNWLQLDNYSKDPVNGEAVA